MKKVDLSEQIRDKFYNSENTIDSFPEEWLTKSNAEKKTKKEWEKIDKKELDKDDKKEKGKHEKDAIKDDQKKIDKLKKGKPSTKKSVEIHDLKKDQEFDNEDKVKYTKGDSEDQKESDGSYFVKVDDRDLQKQLEQKEYKQDKHELAREGLKQKIEHHKDAIKNLEAEIRSLEIDKREDQKDVREES